MEISKVFVLGSGTMGNGIAQVCAQCGISVVMCDLSQDILEIDENFRREKTVFYRKVLGVTRSV